jgi:protein-arginine kinase activator protein McsA
MLCAKCQKNEATLHLTTILHGRGEETIHLCKDCGTEITRLPTLDRSKQEVLPIIGRKCEFCGEDAFSGKLLAGGSMIYWCFDCQAEYRRTFAELFICEHSELMEGVKARSSLVPFISAPQLLAWSAEAGQRVVQILKERRQGNDRDAAI